LTAHGAILAIDTATSRAVVALGDWDGALRGEASWLAGQRHSEELLPRIATLLAEVGTRLEDLGGIVVGTGPGAFTGLRVGLATAKTLADQLGLPLAGVSSAAALLAAAAASRTSADQGDGLPSGDGPQGLVLLLPAGSSDRILVRGATPAMLVPGGREPDLSPGELIVAVDLPDRSTPEASRLGSSAQSGLAAALVRIGAARLAAGRADDPISLVPEYVTMPRGVASADGEIAWSRDLR